MATKKVFILCENDDHGRDLFLGVYDTREEAEDYGGRITYTIYEHETLEVTEVTEEARVPFVGDIVKLTARGFERWGHELHCDPLSKFNVLLVDENSVMSHLCENVDGDKLWLELDEMEIV
tara:strand:+ start:123 stop:485 length:363 start_codon:yes stop_codon:yes gene_type:complete